MHDGEESKEGEQCQDEGHCVVDDVSSENPFRTLDASDASREPSGHANPAPFLQRGTKLEEKSRKRVISNSIDAFLIGVSWDSDSGLRSTTNQ